MFTKNAIIASVIWHIPPLRRRFRTEISIVHLSYCVEKVRVTECQSLEILLVKTKGASIVLTTKEDYLKMVFLRLSYYDNDNNVFFFRCNQFCDNVCNRFKQLKHKTRSLLLKL